MRSDALALMLMDWVGGCGVSGGAVAWMDWGINRAKARVKAKGMSVIRMFFSIKKSSLK